MHRIVGAVSAGTRPPGPFLVYRALKITQSAHRHDNKLRLRRLRSSPCTCRCTQRTSTTVGTSRIATISQRAATVGSRVSSVEFARPAQHGYQPPCPRATGESPWSAQTMKIGLCVTTGMLKTFLMSSNCRKSPVFCTVTTTSQSRKKYHVLLRVKSNKRAHHDMNIR